jgi:glutamine cyclotransferase
MNEPAADLKHDPRCRIKTKQYRVVGCWPHDNTAFTEGLVFHDSFLYESTGLCGSSGLRRVGVHSGRILQEQLVEKVCAEEDCIGSKSCFAEGLTIFKGRVFQLTRRSQKGFIYETKDLRKVGEFSYHGEGWGITHDNQFLIMSNGSPMLQFLDPADGHVIDTVTVTAGNEEINHLNELEYIKGEIYANIWDDKYGNYVARIDPKSGSVLGWIDLTKLCEPYKDVGVLNGIAYCSKSNTLFITGKMWPQLFEIKLLRPRSRAGIEVDSVLFKKDK